MTNKWGFVMAAILLLLFVPTVFADTISLSGNLDDSNSYCNALIDVMRNDPTYDPYYEFVVVRVGDYDYRCYFGPDLDGDLVFYRLVPGSYQTSSSLSRGSASSLTINKNGYYFVGNVPGSLASAQAEQYKLGVVITVSAVFILILVLFRYFRKSEGRKTKFYSVR